jgi:hypothetical protein
MRHGKALAGIFVAASVGASSKLANENASIAAAATKAFVTRQV